MKPELPYSSPVLRVDNLNLNPWLVRLVRPGDYYGLGFCLIHGQPRHGRPASKFESIPMVEFYDFRNPVFSYDFAGSKEEAYEAGAAPLGQFVASYYISTLRESPSILQNGLCLNGSIPDWCVDHILVRKVMAWAERLLALPKEEQPLYTEELDTYGQ